MIAIVYVALIVLGVIVGILALSFLIVLVLWVDTILRAKKHKFCRGDIDSRDEEA